MSRFREILTAVDGMFAAHDEWENDKTAPQQPTEKLENAINHAVDTCRHGEIPQSCRELVAAMERLGKEWRGYQDGDWDRQQRPKPTFWAAWRDALNARAGSEPLQPRQQETVSELRRQNVGYTQIATAIYGHNGRGPFLDDNGAVRVDLIEKQVRFEEGRPGGEQIIPSDWIHPAELERVHAHNEQLEHRLQRADARAEETKPYEEPKSIDECLLEGMLPAQVANVKHVPIDQVWERVRALDLDIDRDPLARPTFGQEPATATTPPSGAEGGAGTAPVDAEQGEGGDGEALADLIVQTAETEPNLGPSEIAAKVAESLGEPVTTQKVVAVLRSRQKPATAGV